MKSSDGSGASTITIGGTPLVDKYFISLQDVNYLYLCSIIASFRKQDLAARNILVADNMASKVADFGLSRELDDSEDNPDSEYQTQVCLSHLPTLPS